MHRHAAVVFASILVFALSVVACEPAKPVDLSISANIYGSSEANVIAGTTLRINLGLDSRYYPETNSVISVTDRLPEGLIFLSGSGPGVECTAEGQDITCITFAKITPGVRKDIHLEIAVDPRLTTGTITNTAQVSYAGDTNSQNNSATVRLTISTPRFATQELDFKKAQDAGAIFLVNQIKNENCTQPGDQLGLTDWTDPTWDDSDPERSDENPIWSKTGGRHAGVEMIAYCGGSGRGEAEAFVEAFGSFKLKNGWIVKSYSQADYNYGRVTFNLDVAPAVGKCRPILKAHIHSYGLSLISGVLKTSHLITAIWITIEGPAGTDPYQGYPSIFCEP